MKIYQQNLNNSPAALGLLLQTASARHMDILILAEPPKKEQGGGLWHWSTDNNAAVVTLNRRLCARKVKTGVGFVTTLVEGSIAITSCYFSPNRPIAVFRRYWSVVVNNYLDLSRKVDGQTIAGDMNAWSSMWGSARQDARGETITDGMTDLDLDIANVGNRPTFDKAGRLSIVEITLADPKTLLRLTGWKVDEESENLSDHLSISYEITEAGPLRPPDRPKGLKRIYLSPRSSARPITPGKNTGGTLKSLLQGKTAWPRVASA